jgi:hypothetical protein
MKTLLVILGLVIGITMGANAQTQTQPKPKPATQTTTTTTTTTQTPAAAPEQTKTMIKITELSKPIQDNLSTAHKGWTPTQAYKLDSKGVITYEVMVKKDASEKRLFYDNAGKFVKEEVVPAPKSSTNKTTTPPKKTTTPAPAAKPAGK